MKSNKPYPVYAQYHEDIVLAAILGDRKHGFYVDVGANHEEYHSVTKYFYERGWNGINIEPIPKLIKEFKNRRKRDINLNTAVSLNRGMLKFREYPNHDGLSTFSERTKKENEKRSIFPFKDYDVAVDSLKNIFKQHNVSQIDFIKIDVEGFEEEVIKSNDWQQYRPVVICIEANHREKDWQSYIGEQGYERVIFDGLNEYYIEKNHLQLMDQFAEKAAIIAHDSIRSHHRKAWDSDTKALTQEIRKNKDLTTELHRLEELEYNTKSIRYLTKQLISQLSQRLGLRGIRERI